MNRFKPHARIQKHQLLRPYVEGEDMTGIAVSFGITTTSGGFIAMSDTDVADQWYITPEYYKANFTGEV